MKKTFFLLCALLLVLGTLLPIAGYRLTLAVFGPAQGASSAPLPGTAASEAAPDSAAVPPSDQGSESFLLADQSAGAVVSVPRREYLIGAVAAEMPISWPDEALKAQTIAQLCPLLPRPCRRTSFRLAERGPRPAAGILNRCSPPQLLGHRL